MYVLLIQKQSWDILLFKLASGRVHFIYLVYTVGNKTHIKGNEVNLHENLLFFNVFSGMIVFLVKLSSHGD